MKAGESLILGSGEQLSLVEVDEHGLPPSAYALGEASGRFTGDRIFSGNPKLYHAIVALLGRGVPYREISEICSVSVNTVCAVCQREGVPIETIRERIGRLGMDVAELTLEAIRDVLADPALRVKLTVKDLAVVHGIAFTNAQLALGGATARMGVLDEKPAATHDDYQRMIDGWMRNVTPATGSSADNPAQRAGALPSPGAVIEVPASTVEPTGKPLSEPSN